MKEYLQVSEIIDWQHPTILQLAQQISSEHSTPVAIAQASFEWVRDRIKHSVDHKMNPVTCLASDVLKYGTVFLLCQEPFVSRTITRERHPNRILLSALERS